MENIKDVDFLVSICSQYKITLSFLYSMKEYEMFIASQSFVIAFNGGE
jgi:hypothetical protein